MSDSTGFTALVLAGDRRPEHPLLQAAGVPCKALVPIGGRAMVLRVSDTLTATQSISRQVLCGPPRAVLEQSPELLRMIASGRCAWLPNQATPSASAYHAMKSLPSTTPILLTTADHALLTSEIVDYFCRHAGSGGYDVVVGLASYALIKQRYPTMRRTVIRLRDGGYCGCNLFAFLTPGARTAAQFWRRVEQQRKQPWRVAGALGWVTILRYLSGRLSLDDALARMSQRLQLRAGAVLLPFAEAAIDVDTVADWQFACRQIAGEP